MQFRAMIAALILLALGFFPTAAHAQELCPDLADSGPGVQRLEGQGTYSFYGIPTIIVDQPVMVMVDDSKKVIGDTSGFPSGAGQVIGQITSDFFSSPFSYTFDLPIVPSATAVDLDHDDVADAGVQVFKVVLAQNVLNTVPLQGFSLAGILSSYYTNAETDEIVEGALVLYAGDDAQGFPCAAGADGKLFTEDDDIATLPAGYTIARIDNGAVTFDRSPVGRVDIQDGPSGATPDFSDQGIVESFVTLVDFLKERYVFNEFNNIDWDDISARYLPRVVEAEDQDNLGLYFTVLVDIAHELRDAHVYLQLGNLVSIPNAFATLVENYAAANSGIGASPVRLDDGRVIITRVDPTGPTAEAGWTFGTEVIAVDGQPVADALAATTNYLEFPGTEEAVRVAQANHLLRRLANTPIEVAYRLPGASEVITSVFTSQAEIPATTTSSIMPLEYRMMDGFGYVEWRAFARTGIATHIFADFIKVMNQRQVPGIIIDLRGNGGGAALMEYAVMSYLFSADNPLSLASISNYSYDSTTGEFVAEPNEGTFSVPPPATAYPGEVVILVDLQCVSACEFMSYWLQASGRATVVGQYATEGGGGNTNAVILPGGIQMNYTAGTELLNETQRPTFQGVGVQPDLRVPVTEEIERLKYEGGDPVLEAGKLFLIDKSLAALDLEPSLYAGGTITSVAPTTWKIDATGSHYANADRSMQISIASYEQSDDRAPDQIAEAIDADSDQTGRVHDRPGNLVGVFNRSRWAQPIDGRGGHRRCALHSGRQREQSRHGRGSRRESVDAHARCL